MPSVRVDRGRFEGHWRDRFQVVRWPAFHVAQVAVFGWRVMVVY